MRGLEEILSGYRRQVAASGMADAELSDLFSAARGDVRNISICRRLEWNRNRDAFAAYSIA